MQDTKLTHEDCLDSYDLELECQGHVEYRMALSGTGIAYPRCDEHWAKRLDVQQGIAERYPTHAPSDWSEMDAGERWDEDY